VIDRGVYKAGETYEPGDAVTWGGSLWIAQKQTDAKPDTPESGFRLAVKRGRDGKDAKKE
jgi:collagen type III alpha